MSRYRDLLKVAADLVDETLPPLVIPNPGLLPRWGTFDFPEIIPLKVVTLDDIIDTLPRHGETSGGRVA